MRHAWQDGDETTEGGQSEASPEHSQDMEDNEFPEIINIPSQENSTSQSQQDTQVYWMDL